jgi:hypothetical protein
MTELRSRSLNAAIGVLHLRFMKLRPPLYVLANNGREKWDVIQEACQWKPTWRYLVSQQIFPWPINGTRSVQEMVWVLFPVSVRVTFRCLLANSCCSRKQRLFVFILRTTAVVKERNLLHVVRAFVIKARCKTDRKLLKRQVGRSYVDVELNINRNWRRDTKGT